jgi:hypothetical protein
MSKAAGGGDRPTDGSASRPSKNNRHGWRERPSHENLPVGPSDLPHAGLRPLSVEPERRLRDEAVLENSEGAQARPWYSVVSEWRDWYDGYLGSHIEYEAEDGETARAPLENSYMPEYGKRYYAKLKDFERGVNRTFEGLTTVMLTLTASHQNANGGWRCPADHMRDVMDGYDAARKQLHKVLSGRNWEYARVWEPHQSGYGHLHLAVFVEDEDGRRDLDAGDFEPVMRSHVENCRPAGWDAHRNRPCEEHATEAVTPWKAAVSGCDDCDVPVSVKDDVGDLGCYISEYIGIFGDETLNRPMTEQMFYATCWATNTRRVDFSNGAHDLMNKEQFRRETGLRPEDRGGECFEDWKEHGVVNETGNERPREWGVKSICSVEGGRPEYADPTTGGVDTTKIAGRSGVDPPPER